MKIAIPISFIAFALLLQVLLLKYYSSGPEAILLVPLAFIIYIGVGILAGNIVTKQGSKSKKAFTYALFLLIISFILSLFHPTDRGIKPHVYLINTIRALVYYNSIDYKTIYAEGELGEPYKALAIKKYRSELPERALVIHYYVSEKVEWEDRVRIVFEKRGNAWKFINLSNRAIKASLKMGTEKAERKEFVIFVITVNGRSFRERYIRDEFVADGYYFQSLDGNWENGQPRIILFEWSKDSRFKKRADDARRFS